MKALTKQSLDDIVEVAADMMQIPHSQPAVRTALMYVLAAIEHPSIPTEKFKASVLDWVTGSSLDVEGWLRYHPGGELQLSLAFPELWDAWQSLEDAKAKLEALTAAAKVGNAKQ